jgi:hypothetical protein
MQIMSAYKISLVFENAMLHDYVTEKLFTAYQAGSLPVYLGAPNIEQWAIAGSYVDASKYTPQQLAVLLQQLLEDEELYESYFEWKERPLPQNFLEKWERCAFHNAACRICEFVKNYSQCSNAAAASAADLHSDARTRVIPRSSAIELRNRMISMWLYIYANGEGVVLSNSESKLQLDKPLNLECARDRAPLLSACEVASSAGFAISLHRELREYRIGLSLFGGFYCSTLTLPASRWAHLAISFGDAVTPTLLIVNGELDRVLDVLPLVAKRPLVLGSNEVLIAALAMHPPTRIANLSLHSRTQFAVPCSNRREHWFGDWEWSGMQTIEFATLPFIIGPEQCARTRSCY